MKQLGNIKYDEKEIPDKIKWVGKDNHFNFNEKMSKSEITIFVGSDQNKKDIFFDLICIFENIESGKFYSEDSNHKSMKAAKRYARKFMRMLRGAK